MKDLTDIFASVCGAWFLICCFVIIISFMEFVRHRVERLFTDPIKLLLKGCSIEARNRPRITKTGGFLFHAKRWAARQIVVT